MIEDEPLSTFFYIFAVYFIIMTTKIKRNHITIAKAIGIILMVTCHAGIPNAHITNFIYVFHMPLFFFCSGYFFKEISQWNNLQQFVSRRFSGLYIPYLKYSFAFILLNNLFFQLYICNTAYGLDDYIWHSIRAVTMNEYEELMLRPFWFLKSLLLSSISIAILSFICNKHRKFFHAKTMLVIAFAITMFFMFWNLRLPLIGNCSLITFGMVYLYSGYIYRQHEVHLQLNKSMLIILFMVVLLGSLYFQGIIDMRYTTTANTIPYYVLSILGIIFVFDISKRFNNSLPNKVKNPLYYIGNHTMPVLALHLLIFKLGNFIKILIYDFPIIKLSDHTIIHEHNTYFWIIYLILGITIPLLLNHLYNKFTDFIIAKQ